MMPRTPNPQILQPPLRSSPKFGSKNSMNSPQIDRRVLLDQIINNCERAESPLGARKSYQSTKNSLFRSGVAEEKQNVKVQLVSNGPEPSLGCRMSYEYQILSPSRPMIEFNKEKRSSISSNGLKSSGFLQSQKIQQQYFKMIPKQPNSPAFRLRIPIDLPKARRSNSSQKQSQQKVYQINIKKIEEEQKICKIIADERQKHLDYCKREQRKARLYYVQLQNKLCQLRSKELKMLAEYEATKLKEYDKYFNSVKNGESNLTYDEHLKKLDQLKLGQIVKVNQSIKPQVQGCLYNGISGIYFSFDQKHFDFNHL